MKEFEYCLLQYNEFYYYLKKFSLWFFVVCLQNYERIEVGHVLILQNSSFVPFVNAECFFFKVTCVQWRSQRGEKPEPCASHPLKFPKLVYKNAYFYQNIQNIVRRWGLCPRAPTLTSKLYLSQAPYVICLQSFFRKT